MKSFGKPHIKGKIGAPAKIKGAATVISRRCFIM
jgi:hypothetical protein